MKNKYFNSIVPELITPAKIKPLVYHITLTSAYTKCPYCGAVNPDEPDGWEQPLNFPDGYCRGCCKKYDDINIITKKSKDVLALEFYYKEFFGIET